MFHLPGQVSWANRGSSHWFTLEPHNSQLIYGGLWKTNHQYSTTSPQLLEKTCRWYICYHQEDTRMPFLDTIVTINDDGNLNTKVYRKPTHTDLYLQWDSHHAIAAKYSMINTLHHRAKAVCSQQTAPERGRGPPTESSHRKQIPNVGPE